MFLRLGNAAAAERLELRGLLPSPERRVYPATLSAIKYGGKMWNNHAHARPGAADAWGFCTHYNSA